MLTRHPIRAGLLIAMASSLLASIAVIPRGAVAAGNTYTVSNTNDSGSGSLRQAILDANGSPGLDTIRFSISPGGGVKTINLSSELPHITTPVDIQGDTQSGYTTSPVIELNGNSAGGGKNGLIIDLGGSGTTIRALTINRFKGDGIALTSASNCVIAGCYIGTNNTGSAQSGNNKNGIEITNGQNNRIGGTAPADHNLISGNSQEGILLTNCTGTTILGNSIGTNLAGNAEVHNGNNGILVSGGSGNQIGGTNATDANLISGNSLDGIFLYGGTENNGIRGNILGANAGGTAGIHNGRDGIEVGDSQNGAANSTTIGGANPYEPNLIAFNQQKGIHIASGTGNVVKGNSLLSNSEDGIQIGPANNNTIGGINNGEGNLIRDNQQIGIHVANGGGTGNALLRNLIYRNGRLAIDLRGDGVTANDTQDPDTGPNNLQNYPVLTSAVTRSGIIIRGTLNSTPNAQFRLEFFGNEPVVVSTNRPAETYLGALDVTTDPSGNATFKATVVAAPNVNYVVATATLIDVANNRYSDTSELSADIPVTSNHAPTAVADSYTTEEDETLTVAAPGVLGNDSDSDEDPLTAVLDAGPAHGTLSLSANGGFTYAPTANYNGPDSFTYHANDGLADSGTVTVSLTVNAENDTPVAVDDSYTTEEDETLTINAPGVLTNDTDVDGDTLQAVLDTGPAHGTLTLNLDGSFTYAPSSGYSGPDSFTYRAYDGPPLGNLAPAPRAVVGSYSNLATVHITVEPEFDVPVAYNGTAYTRQAHAVTVTLLATDDDNDISLYTIESDPSHGTLTPTAQINQFLYTPDPGYSGTDEFEFYASDGHSDSNITTETVNICPWPVAFGDTYGATRGVPLPVSAPGVLANDLGITGKPLSAVLVSGPSHGTLTLNPDGSFVYRAWLAFSGVDHFTYKATSAAPNNTAPGSQYGTGTRESDPATVTINVSSTLPRTTGTGAASTGTVALNQVNGPYILTLMVRSGTPLGLFSVRVPRGASIQSQTLTSATITSRSVRLFGKARTTEAGTQEFVLDLDGVPGGAGTPIRFRLELANGKVYGPQDVVHGAFAAW